MAALADVLRTRTREAELAEPGDKPGWVRCVACGHACRIPDGDFRTWVAGNSPTHCGAGDCYSECARSVADQVCGRGADGYAYRNPASGDQSRQHIEQ